MNDRTREQAMTITALQRQAVELDDENARLREQKLRLVVDHADERDRRQSLEVAVEQARAVIADLQALSTRERYGESNEGEAYAVLQRADAWLEAHGGGR